MATGDVKKAKAKLDELAVDLTKENRKVKVVRISKKQADDLAASFGVNADAYVIEEEVAGGTTAVTLMMMPTRMEAD